MQWEAAAKARTFNDCKIEQETGNNDHNSVFPGTRLGEESSKTRFKRKIGKNLYDGLHDSHRLFECDGLMSNVCDENIAGVYGCAALHGNRDNFAVAGSH